MFGGEGGAGGRAAPTCFLPPQAAALLGRPQCVRHPAPGDSPRSPWSLSPTETHAGACQRQAARAVYFCAPTAAPHTVAGGERKLSERMVQ